MSLAEPETESVSIRKSGLRSNIAALCVLVVEDDDADAYLIERALRAHPDVGQIVRAADGVDALRLVETRACEPDLAIIDLHMPRKSGFELLRDLAGSRQARFPIVVLTSSTEPTDDMCSLVGGSVRVLAKPESAVEIEAILAPALRSAQLDITPSKHGRAAPKRNAGFDEAQLQLKEMRSSR